MKRWTRLIALLLAVMSVVQILPLNVLAAAEETEEETRTQISEVILAEATAQTVQASAETEPAEQETEPAVQETEPDYGVAALSDDTDFVWTLEAGVLTISGTGEMPWSWSSVPWYDQKDTVTTVVIESGVTTVSAAFSEHTALTAVTLPDTVTDIQGGAFMECTALTEIDLLGGITLLQDSLFEGCTALERVGLPSGLTDLNSSVFADCTSLKSIDLPDSVVYMGANVFENSGLESVRIPKSSQTIWHCSFLNCASLKSVTLQEGLLSIAGEAFKGCTALESITFPDSLESIDTGAFRGCTSLTEVTIPAKTGVYSNGYDAADSFYGCTGLTKVTVQDGAASVGGFHGCTSLTELVLPDSITTISEGAFEGCTGLTQIDLPASLENLGDKAFYGCTGITQLELPANLEMLGGLSGTGITELVIPETVTHLYTFAFQDCLSLKTVKLPADLTTLPYGAFSGCSALESIELPAGLTSIPSYCFRECIMLTEVTIPEGVTSIGLSAFAGSGLKELTLPGTITSLGDYAFNRCVSLETVTLGEGMTTLGEETFSDCTSLKSVTFPSTMKSTGSYAFEGCTSLETLVLNEGLESFTGVSGCTALKGVTIPSTLTSGSFGGSGLEWAVIADGMTTLPSLFSGCSLLTEVVIPDSVTAIADSAFQYCAALTSIDIPDGVTSIGAYAFRGCTALVDVTLPEGLQAIENYTFYGCSALTAMVIPGSVAAIGDYAFYGCKGLEEVVIQDGVTSIGSNAFSTCTGLTRIVIPASVTSIGSNAFYKCAGLTIYAVPDSYAWTYAEENGIPVVSSIQGSDELSLTVLGSDGNALTSGYTVNWYETDGENVIAAGNTLSGVSAESLNYEYEILLGEELSYQYYAPGRHGVAEMDVSHTLVAIGTVSVTGTVTDGEGNALAGAQIAITQTYNDQYTRTASAATDGYGKFTVQLAAVDTTADISLQGYFSRTAAVNLEQKSGSYDMGTFALNPVSGNKVTLSIMMQGACAAGESALYQYVTAEELTIEVYNVSRSQAVKELEYQHPDLMLGKSQVSAGEQIRITLTDPKGKMAAQSVTLTLDENACGAENITFVERGGFEIGGLAGADRAHVMIFDGSGKLYGTAAITGAYTSDPLPAGAYQVVILRDNDLLRSAANISVLAELGLTAGTDYATKSITVSDGLIQELGAVSVPALDEAKLRYTVPEHTSFTANYQRAYPGKYVMLRLEYEIDAKYQTSGQSLILELPENVEILRDSATLDGKTVGLSVSGRTVTVNTGTASGVLRCYVSSDTLGSYDISAYLGATLSGSAVKQALGTVSLEITAGEITVPERTAQSGITVRGMTVPNSGVQVYANDELVGTTTSNAAGSWSASVPLNDHYSRSAYEIHAVISSQEREYTTDSKWVLYDASIVELSTVTMHNTDLHGDHEVTTFDFRHDQGRQTYFADPGTYPKFSFAVAFTGGDDTVIKNVKVIVQDSYGRTSQISCAYTGGSQWLGTKEFHKTSELPVAIGVQYELVEQSEEPVMDAQRIQDAEDAMAQADAELEELKTSVTVTDMPDYESMSNEELMAELEAMLEQEEQYAADTDYLITSALQELNADIQKDGDSYVVTMNDTGTILTLGSPESTEHDKLVAEGYTAIASTDGSYVYQKEDSGTVSYLDPDNGLLLTARSTAVTYAGGGGDELEQLQNVIETAREVLGNVVSVLSSLKKTADEIFNSLAKERVRWRELNLKRKNAAEELERRIKRDEALGFKGDWESVNNEIRLKRLKQGIERANKNMDKYWQELGKWLKAKNGLRTLKFASILYDLATIADYAGKLITLYRTLKDCPGAEQLKADICILAVEMAASLGVTIASYVAGTGALVVATGATMGTAVVPAILTWIGITVATIAATTALSNLIENKYNEILEKAKQLGCSPDPENKQQLRYMSPMVDPSGYVYEAVPSNRLEGVKAEIYYVENGKEIRWDAENYDQANPLYTDSEGKYQWDVPFGLWLVKYTREGYLDTDSKDDPAANADGYLPVPPPQVDVNVGMVSTAAPQVESLNVYQDQIQVIFSQYMKPETVALTVNAGGKSISGKVEAANAEYNYEGTAQYATVFNFTPDTTLSGNVSVSISGAVNYAGTPMASGCSQTQPVAYRPKSISVAQTATVAYGGTAQLELQVLPAEAGVNKTLTVTAQAAGIADVDQQTVTTDGQGKATITLRGTLPGDGPVTIALDGTDLTAEVVVSVTMGQTAACEKVTASIASGSAVVPGTQLTLSTATAGAKIYYTLDGTCPCVEGSASRMEYTGPITIDGETFLIAYAVKEGMEDSATAAFTYTIQGNPFKDVAQKDYFYSPVLWAVSKGITTGLTADTFGPDENCSRGQVVTFLWRAAGKPEPSNTHNPFKDVKETDYYYKAVLWAVEKGITTGLTADTFGPNDDCTRGQVATFLWRAAGKPQPASQANAFGDVKETDYFFSAVLWAVERGITNGYGSSDIFYPEGICSRGQVVTFLYRAQ